MSSNVDPAFVGVGKEPGLTLWRIEKKLVVKQSAVSEWRHCQLGRLSADDDKQERKRRQTRAAKL